MPTYVYKFTDTGETIEVHQSFDEPTLTEAPHPSDGQPRAVRKVFTPVGVTFKGNGFYKTDNRSSKNGASTSSSSTKDTTSSSSEGSPSKESETAAKDTSSSASTSGSSSSGSGNGSSAGAGSAAPHSH